MKMDKKAQAQIITTVLIILLVLAAIVIVWQVVSGTIQSGGEEIESQSKCIGVTMEVTKALVTNTTVTIRRGQGDTTTVVTGYKVYVGGANVNSTTVTMNPLDTQVVGVGTALVSGDKVEAAAVIGDVVCSPSSSVTVA